MPNIGPMELIIVLVIVLVVFGPKRLPGLGRQLGSGMREFKDSITGESKQPTLTSGQEAQAPPPAAQPAAQPVATPVATPAAGEAQAPEAPAPSGPPAG